jgi:hypothetical protein
MYWKMRKNDFKKETIDALGKGLVKNDRLPMSEIDRIIEAPGLFELVNRRIADTQKASAEPSARLAGWIPAAAASVACLVVLTILGVNILRENKEVAIGPSAVSQIEVPDAGPELARPEIPPKEVFGKLSPGRASYQKARNNRSAARTKRPSRTTTPEPVVQPKSESEGFYAISFTGEGEVTGGRVIRVDMPRSSLFALGMNVPLENGPELVKTDLLIGADGTPKGIRLVE